MASQPVVVGVDGSPQSIGAAALAWRIARAANAPCLMITVLPDLWTPGITGDVAVGPALFDALVAEVRDQLATELGSTIPASVRNALVVRTGRPGPKLLAFAREQGAGVIVVGARPRGVMARSLGGSTAHHLVRTADVPVLVAEHKTAAPRRLLVAIDLINAPPVLATARRMAELLKLRLRALHVVEPSKFSTRIPLPVDQDALSRKARTTFERLLDADLPNLAAEDRVVRRGHAEEVIAEEAATWQADFLVIGSHGRGWIDRMLVGSTTERLLNSLPTSLMVVPITA